MCVLACELCVKMTRSELLEVFEAEICTPLGFMERAMDLVLFIDTNNVSVFIKPAGHRKTMTVLKRSHMRPVAHCL